MTTGREGARRESFSAAGKLRGNPRAPQLEQPGLRQWLGAGAAVDR
jgi:hypothetical protein